MVVSLIELQMKNPVQSLSSCFNGAYPACNTRRDRHDIQLTLVWSGTTCSDNDAP
jgi:hypothetical protein